MSKSSGTMSSPKKLLFLTGTRADFGKLKTLMLAADKNEMFDVAIFVTGMHMMSKYGYTVIEVEKCAFKSVVKYINQRQGDTLDIILANTIRGIGDYVHEQRPDMIIVHGDRVEALAGALVGALNNILVAHIEGGEISGTIDELIRHSASKLSHIHFVANDDAKQILIQMGEKDSSIYVIGSPDLDLMTSNSLPAIDNVKRAYEIEFEKYSMFIYHPVTTDLHNILEKTKEVALALKESGKNYVMIYPNNDPGSDIILEELMLLAREANFKIFPSIRFEAFLVLLKNSEFIIGNSSAAIREAPFYAVPAVNIGSRQNNRFTHQNIFNVNESRDEILTIIRDIKKVKPASPCHHFGDGKSAELFIKTLSGDDIWRTDIQKQFVVKSK